MSKKKLVLIILGLGGVAYLIMRRKEEQSSPSPSDTIDYGFGDAVNETLNNPDEGCPQGIVQGCNQPEATNYNPCVNNPTPATCTYPPGVVAGCMNPNAQNYNPEATVSIPSQCVAQGLGQCGDPDACNYTAGAITSAGACIYPAGVDKGNKNNCNYPAFIGYAGSLSNYSPCITCEDYNDPNYMGPL